MFIPGTKLKRLRVRCGMTIEPSWYHFLKHKLSIEIVASLVVRLVIGLVFAVFGLFNYFGNVTENPVTGESQRVQMTPKQEIV
jgi:hypothetical protein